MQASTQFLTASSIISGIVRYEKKVILFHKNSII